MKKSRFTEEQMIQKLRNVELLLFEPENIAVPEPAHFLVVNPASFILQRLLRMSPRIRF